MADFNHARKRQRADEVAWHRLRGAAERHADALIESFETRDRWPLKEGYKLLHRSNVRDAIVAWAEETCNAINGGGPKNLGGKIIHPPPLGDDGNLVLPDERDLQPFLQRYVYGALRQDLLTAYALTREALAKGGRPHRVAPELWQELEPDFKQSRASIDGKAVLFRVEIEPVTLLGTTATAGGRQTGRVKPALKKRFPPDGRVPNDVGTEHVRTLIARDLAADSRNRGLGEPSWDVVNRALGRDKK